MHFSANHIGDCVLKVNDDVHRRRTVVGTERQGLRPNYKNTKQIVICQYRLLSSTDLILFGPHSLRKRSSLRREN
jgi:hypothetical protein